ncbi:MAG TPA: AAA family ATPase [Solirubrobacteraceae bacterium]|jgi:predicted ATPase
MILDVQLTNFKSFKKATVPLGPLTLIVGANGSGKSNFFDALRFLSFIGNGVPIRDAIEGHISAVPSPTTVSGIRGGQKEIVNLGVATDTRIFEMRARMRVNSETVTYFIAVDAANYRVVAEELKSSAHPGPYVYSTRPEVGALESDPDSPSIAARYYKETRGLNPKTTFSPHEALLSQFVGRKAASNLNEEVANQVRTELQAVRPLELRPETLREYSRLGNFEIGEHGENFAAAAWLLQAMASGPSQDKESQAQSEVIKGWLSELTPHKIADYMALASPTEDVIFALSEDNYRDEISARSLSDGTLRFAAFAFIVFGARGRRTLAIEEFENGINPARLSLLMRMFEEATRSEPALQVIATTHSPGILNWMSSDTLRDAVAIGWDQSAICSHVVRLRDLKGVEEALKTASIGDLQSEGWIQFAADL